MAPTLWPERRPERGATAVALLAVVGVCTLLVTGLAHLGMVGVTRARLDAVADLSAVAAVVGGPGSAGRVAVANGAHLERVQGAGDVWVVTIRSAGGVATAAARPARLRGTPNGRG